MKSRKAYMSLALTVAILGTSLAPSFANSYEGNDSTPGISVESNQTMDENNNYGEEENERGIKGKAAKVLAKLIKDGLVQIGKDKWDDVVLKAVKSLPIKESVRNNVIKCLGYRSVAELADSLLDFQGTAEDGMNEFFKSIGVNDDVSYWAARVISLIFL